jgi:3-methylcrotonyl-CoA carboxylase alpha subunit
MEEKLTIGGQATSVAARPAEPDRIRLDVNGSALEARVVSSSGGCHVVELDGCLETLFTARSGAATWVWHRGRARLVEPVERRSAPAPRNAGAGAAGATGRPGAVTPPMPGVVVAVLVEPGRIVSRGDALVVVAAMKTETQLAAPLAGRVMAVNARVGAKVRPGDVLVEIEPEVPGHAG